MAEDKNLPEGTDKIIAGASGASGPDRSDADEVVIAEAVLVAEVDVPAAAEGSGAASAGSGSSGPGSSSEARQGGPSGGRQGLVERVRSGGERISGQAAGKARGLVGQGLERSGEALANVGRLVGDTAPGLEERLGPDYGEYARRAAQAIEDTAESLRSKDPDELIDDARDFVRKAPGVAIAGAAIVGFALARLVKTGLDAGSGGAANDDSAGARSRSRGED
jgi:ElaB/YqjD/DUF883 family membrane-anchored ribosome-binding protein